MIMDPPSRFKPVERCGEQPRQRRRAPLQLREEWILAEPGETLADARSKKGRLAAAFPISS